MSAPRNKSLPAALGRSLEAVEWRERRRAVLALTDVAPPLAWPHVERALGDLSDDVRHAAVLVAGRLGLAEARDGLLKPRILDSPDPNLRWSAVQALGRLGDPRDIIPLTRHLQDKDWLVRNEARKVLAEAVGRLGDCTTGPHAGAAVDTLIHLLFLESETLRPLVIRNLCRHGSRALPALRESLHEPSPSMLAGVVRVLGLLYDKHSLPELVRLAGHPDRRVRHAVAEALGRLGGPDAARTLVRMMAVRQEDVCDAAGAALAELGSEAVAPIIELLQHETCARLRVRCIILLGRLGAPEALPLLREGLRSSYFHVRQATIQALVAYGPSLVHDLLPLLRVGSPEVEGLLRQLREEASLEGRLRLIRVIGETGNHAAVPHLKAIRDQAADEEGFPLRRGVNQALYRLGCASWERYCLLAVLGQVATEAEAEALLPSLEHPSYYVRNRAVHSLARFAVPAVGKALARVADTDARFFVRRTALQVLGSLGVDKDLRFRTALAAMKDSAPGVRVEAARVLGRLVMDRAVPVLSSGLLDEVWSVRESCEIALRNFASKAVKPVSRLLDEEREVVRLRAARLLGDLGDAAARPALRRRLAREEVDRVRAAIERSLAQLKD
jgi:HEAT repeat protein